MASRSHPAEGRLIDLHEAAQLENDTGDNSFQDRNVPLVVFQCILQSIAAAEIEAAGLTRLTQIQQVGPNDVVMHACSWGGIIGLSNQQCPS